MRLLPALHSRLVVLEFAGTRETSFYQRLLLIPDQIRSLRYLSAN
jgi:hypothetical protein